MMVGIAGAVVFFSLIILLATRSMSHMRKRYGELNAVATGGWSETALVFDFDPEMAEVFFLEDEDRACVLPSCDISRIDDCALMISQISPSRWMLKIKWIVSSPRTIRWEVRGKRHRHDLQF